MLKKFTALFLCALTAIGLSGCGETQKSAVDSSKLHVLVSFDAMKEFVSAVGKDKVSVTAMIPDGMEPHDFEPKAQDLISLSKAQVFVYNGLGMESWADKATQSAGNATLISVNASDGADVIKNTDDAELQEHGQYDPHLWLSLKGAQTEVQNITAGLVKADPSNSAFYEQNCKAYIAQLEALYTLYNDKFRSVRNTDFVTGHAAFAYLCRDFGLTQNSVEDVFAEGEPTAKQMAALVTYCQQHQVSTIFSEEMTSPEVSKTLAQEVGANVETIYTMESAEDGKSYLERATINLEKIYKSFSTQTAS